MLAPKISSINNQIEMASALDKFYEKMVIKEHRDHNLYLEKSALRYKI